MTSTSHAEVHDEPTTFRDGLSLIRFHIILVAMSGALVFGWMMTGKVLWAVTLTTAADWFLINLINRVTDLDEDFRNEISATAVVARYKRELTFVCAIAMALSFAATYMWTPSLIRLRVGVQFLGIAYNFRVVPTPRGLRRLKEMYALKNVGSAGLFLMTCFAYPLAFAPHARTMGWEGILTLAVFFALFELTFEIIYDLRDIDGDAREGVLTFPVVHGAMYARQIVRALLLGAGAVLAIGFVAHWLGVREALLGAALVVQYLFFERGTRARITPRDCIWMTHSATLQLLFYFAGNTAWLRLGLPSNIFY